MTYDNQHNGREDDSSLLPGRSVVCTRLKATRDLMVHWTRHLQARADRGDRGAPEPLVYDVDRPSGRIRVIAMFGPAGGLVTFSSARVRFREGSTDVFLVFEDRTTPGQPVTLEGGIVAVEVLADEPLPAGPIEAHLHHIRG